ncbi:hypothetical protein TorRG33x02_047920 [Trema orientale]|uniref:Uncharacterized protein n=1 Tax=Trema orientale TaxID=63057 RepID=A0A2P5FP99_TREOI|nr:hypothetical protein TorRG33x02_047920 [Trema orientale]
MANKKRRAGRAGRAADQVNLPALITTEEEQGRVRVDHRDDKNNESGVPFWISAWWRDYQMPHMLVRWAITVCAVALFYKQMKNNSLLLTLALPFHVSSYTKRIYSTLRDGVRSAKNGYNAFKLFLRALPEYDIW